MHARLYGYRGGATLPRDTTSLAKQSSTIAAIRLAINEYNCTTLHLIDIHALRASQTPSYGPLRPARGCSARQRATAEPCTAVVLLRVRLKIIGNLETMHD